MARSPAKYQVYGLQENYIGTGVYSLKIVISPRFKTGVDFGLKLVDSDMKEIYTSVSYWGRKLNVEFKIDPNTADGLALGIVSRAGEKVGQFTMWIIK
jgi:hypothetical protein